MAAIFIAAEGKNGDSSETMTTGNNKGRKWIAPGRGNGFGKGLHGGGRKLPAADWNYVRETCSRKKRNGGKETHRDTTNRERRLAPGTKSSWKLQFMTTCAALPISGKSKINFRLSSSLYSTRKGGSVGGITVAKLCDW